MRKRSETLVNDFEAACMDYAFKGSFDLDRAYEVDQAYTRTRYRLLKRFQQLEEGLPIEVEE